MLGWKHWLAAWACCGMLLYPAGSLVIGAEPAAAEANPTAVSAESPQPAAALELMFIPAGATAAAIFHPQPLLTGPNAEWMPVEVITASGMQQFGVDPVQIREAVFLFFPPDAARPMPAFGVIVRFSQPYSAAALLAKLPNPQEAEADGKKIYALPGPDHLCLSLPDERTILLAAGPATLGQMLAAKDADSPLIKLLKVIDCSATYTAIASLDAMRDLIDQGLAHAPPLPPPLADFLKAPKLTSAAFFRLDLAHEAQINLTLRALDEPSAAELLKLVQQGLAMGRQVALGQMMAAQRGGNDAVQQAGLKYTTRIVNRMFDLVQPVQAGRDVKVSLHFDSNVAVVGVLIGLLLPAVQSAREAARRMQSANNLKQIGLAMFTHETVFGQFPPRAIFDKDGKPLLSWRVKILPYLDEQALFDEFHLDEAWDSPHNKPLLAKMPPVYRNPNRPVDTKTNYLLPVGTGAVFEGKTGRKIAEITDGTSNTILLVEANEDQAVEWTKPDDLEVNLEKPLAGLGQLRPNGFYAVFCDGSVHMLRNDVSPAVLKALFTIAGGEPIDPGSF